MYAKNIKKIIKRTKQISLPLATAQQLDIANFPPYWYSNCQSRGCRSPLIPIAGRIRQDWLDEVEEQPTNQSHLLRRMVTSDNFCQCIYRYIFRPWRHSTDFVEHVSSIISRRLNRFQDNYANELKFYFYFFTKYIRRILTIILFPESHFDN